MPVPSEKKSVCKYYQLMYEINYSHRIYSLFIVRGHILTPVVPSRVPNRMPGDAPKEPGAVTRLFRYKRQWHSAAAQTGGVLRILWSQKNGILYNHLYSVNSTYIV